MKNSVKLQYPHHSVMSQQEKQIVKHYQDLVFTLSLDRFQSSPFQLSSVQFDLLVIHKHKSKFGIKIFLWLFP